MLNAKREKQRQDRKLVKGTSLLSTSATRVPSAPEAPPGARWLLQTAKDGSAAHYPATDMRSPQNRQSSSFRTPLLSFS